MTESPRFPRILQEQKILSEAECQRLMVRFKDDLWAMLLWLVEQMPHRMHELGKCWGDSLGLAYVDPLRSIVQEALVRKLTASFAKEHWVLPLYDYNGIITVAMMTPDNAALVQRVGDALMAPVSPVFSFPEQIQAILEIVSVSNQQLAAMAEKVESQLEPVTGEMSRKELEKLADKREIVEFVRGLLLQAICRRASDIHIEPDDKRVRVRYRIDGALAEAFSLGLGILPPLVNRFKIMTNADISENRRPQDGRMSLALPGKSIDFRFSCVPTIYGEKVVLRILGQSEDSGVPDIEDLGFSRQVYDVVQRVIRSPNGIFFVTGPTGSGKTTTLYSILKRINTPDVNIMTIEDPVEIRLPGINHVQVNIPAGVTFAEALRAFLRQDPDVILVGEIRDLETALIASQAALTGHLVLATLHTNSALKSIARLVQIGVEPYLVAPSLVAVMAQRLVRRLCEHCKEPQTLSPKEIQTYFEWDGQTPVSVFRPKGCDRCNMRGYFGRVAIHEICYIDNDLRNLIAANASLNEIETLAVNKGFQNLRYDGFKKALRGLTAIEEVDRVAVVSE